MKKLFSWIFRKKWLILAIVLCLWLCCYFFKDKIFHNNAPMTYESTEHTVKKGEISKTLNLSWTTQFANAQKLTFVSEGRVTWVNVKVGQQVKKGDVLATISTDNLDKEIEDLKRNLKNAQNSYNDELDKSDKSYDIQKTENDLNLLKAERQTLPSELEIKTQEKASDIVKNESNIKLKEVEIKTKERELKDKQKEFENVQKDYEKLQNWDKGELLSTPEQTRKWNDTMLEIIKVFKDRANKLQDDLYEYDKVVKVSNNYTQDEKNIYLWAKNQNKMNQSIQKYWDLSSYQNKLNKLYEEYSKLPLDKITKEQMLKSYSIFTEIGNELREWWQINTEAFSNSIDTVDLSKDTINWYVKTFWRWFIEKWDEYIELIPSTSKKLAELKSVKSPLEELKEKVEKTKNELDKLQIGLLEEQNSLISLRTDLNKKQLEYQLEQQQNAVAISKKDKDIKDMEKTLIDLRSGKEQKKALESKRDWIEAAQLALKTKMKEYDNYKIIANFDGVVTKVNMQVGDSVWNSRNSSDSDWKYIYMETPDLLEVKLEVDQIDITKIQIGMEVDVFVDAFEWTVNKWKFSEIDTMPENNTYKAKVVFKKANEKDKIFGGMSANVQAKLESQKNVLLVPNPAIADNNQWQKVVRWKNPSNWNWEDKVVETWLSDETNTVITSWLKEGDVIRGFYMNETAMNQMWFGNWSNLVPWEWGIQQWEDGAMYYQAG